MRQKRSGGLYQPKYTTGVMLRYIGQNEVARVSPAILARLGFTIASI